jgi:hypothetical protein
VVGELFEALAVRVWESGMGAREIVWFGRDRRSVAPAGVNGAAEACCENTAS